MANPLLNDKAMGLGNLDQPNNTWAPPTAEPMTDGPISRWDSGIMTVRGTASATLMLLVLLIASATVTWMSIDEPLPGEAVQLPTGWLFGGLIVALIAVLVGTFKPHLAKFAAPVYALAEGVVVGDEDTTVANTGIRLEKLPPVAGPVTALLEFIFCAGNSGGSGSNTCCGTGQKAATS